MAIDEKELEILRKAAAKVTATDSRRSPWQEHFKRGLNVTQEEVLDTSVVAGFAGGWASSYNYGEGSQTNNPSSNSFASDSRIPTPVRDKVIKLGKPGVSDVDFVPYNWRTNRAGVRGPSLVGHPISYSVRGPTLKSPFTNWTWKVTFGAGPHGGDLLEMDVQADGTAATVTAANSAYNVGAFVMGDEDELNGGVYIIIHLDGSQPGSIPAGRNGLLVKNGKIETATNEIFRVAGLYLEGDITTNGAIELHPDKSLLKFYEDGIANQSIAGITMFTPYVARMVAIPGSGAGVGREQTFITISPEEAAGSDNYPPFAGGSNTWLSGGFEPSGFSGDTVSYQGTLDLPIPRPLKQGRGTILRDPVGPTLITNRPGTWTLTNVENHDVSDSKKSIYIYDIEFIDVSSNTIENVESALGWYFIDEAVAGEYRLNRVVEVNPETGFPFFGPGPIHIGASGTVKVYFTVHDRVDSIWTNTTFDIDNVSAVRIRNIINPRDVERSTKLVSESAPNFDLPAGATPATPDRAIFNTKSTDTGGAIPNSDDPGNLSDLGFRVVVYPSKLREISPSEPELQVVPDFDHPLIGNDVIIDPSISEDQNIEFDYASGTLYLSHAPSVTEVNDILPTGSTGSIVNNRRSEVVLFVACVPGSMEPSQRNGGMRVVCQNPNDTDLFSSQVISAIDTGNTVIDASAPFFDTNDEVVLSDSFLQTIPETGIFDVVESGIGTTSFGTWLYRSRREQDFGGGDVTVLEGITSLTGAVQPVGASLSVIFRREVTISPLSGDNSVLIDDVRFDTTYGSSARASTLRFSGATCTQQLDGSVKVEFPGVSGNDLSVEDEGVVVESATQTLNFMGQGVTAATVGGNQVNVTINGTVGVQDETVSVNPSAHFLNFEGAGVVATVSGLGIDVTIPGGAAAGAWELIDTQFVATATASILTFSGLDSENDGIYCFMGRIISDGANNLDFTIEPDSVSASQKTIFEGLNNTGTLAQIINETSDLFLCFNTSGPDGGPGDPAAIFFEYYIYPKLALHGGTAATAGVRITHGRVTMTIPLDPVAENPTFGFNVHGFWDDTTSTFTNIDIVGDFIQGTEVSLYKITV